MFRQRNLLPIQAWNAHIYGNQAIFSTRTFQNPRYGFDGTGGTSFFLHNQVGNAAGGVATGARFRAVRIVNPHKNAVRFFRRFENNKLVEPYAAAAVAKGANLIPIKPYGGRTTVNDDEVVAQAVHFSKGILHLGSIATAPPLSTKIRQKRRLPDFIFPTKGYGKN